MIKRIYKWAIVIACIHIFATACDSKDPYYYPYEDWTEKMGEYTKLTVLKTANVDSFSGPDEQIEYTITITNSGEIALHHQIDVIDKLIDLECENDYVQPFSEHTLTEFRWEGDKYNWKSLTNKKPGGLRPGDSFECTGGYLTTEEDVLAGMISNSVSVSQEYTMEFTFYMQGCGCTAPLEIESESFFYQSSDVDLDIPFDSQPSISLNKSVTPEFYSGGETVTYVYEITNTGNAPLYEPFTIKDDLVDDVFCPGGFVLQPGQTFPCEATYFIDPGLRWTITNNAQAFTSLDGLSIESNIASASVNYRQPEVVPEKEPTPCPPGVCD